MASQIDGSFDYTATGVLGDKRNTMLRNELHLRDKVGHVKTRGFALPSEGYVYGLPNDRRDFNAAYALRGWAGTYPEQIPFSSNKQATERDFMHLNRGALTAGLVKPTENFDYRAMHDIRQPLYKNKRSGKMSRRLPPTMVFGVPSRPSTPIYELLEHKYQDKWLATRQKEIQAKRSAEAKRRVMSAPLASRGNQIIYETRASVLRTFQNPVDPPPLWHLTRFTTSARPHIQTFRTDASKSGALKNLETDRIARQGNYGSGIYESAKY
uniref:Cilia- and flagella-associated protein 77 n=1 Tax=Arion vulgaris TaxID=1028688 RepID=A0A0B6ZTJ0_9EUPU